MFFKHFSPISNKFNNLIIPQTFYAFKFQSTYPNIKYLNIKNLKYADLPIQNRKQVAANITKSL
ncbi:hypothetical protein [Campylobacter concisus]|jgi:hypothetical protein